MNRILPWQYNLRRIEAITPSLRYDGKRDFADWQTEARAKLSELLGLSRIQKPENPDFVIEYNVAKRVGHKRVRARRCIYSAIDEDRICGGYFSDRHAVILLTESQ